jgi:hypothetical protein
MHMLQSVFTKSMLWTLCGLGSLSIKEALASTITEARALALQVNTLLCGFLLHFYFCASVVGAGSNYDAVLVTYQC